MSGHVARAGMLYEQGRPEQALQEVAHALAEDPDDAMAHALAALCNLGLDKIRVAREHAEEAVRADPELPFAHYALATTFLVGNRLDEALQAAEETLRLESEEASNHALLGSIHLSAKRYPEAIAAAEDGLRLEPRDIQCMNLRARALAAQGATGEATDVLEAALAEAPEDDDTHASLGWACLRAGETDRAKKHFAEALRIDPENEWAREGMTTALKARNVVYRLVLKWYLWVGSMSSGAQWRLLIGLWLLYVVSRQVSDSFPAVAPWLLPLQIVYLGFCVLTWLSEPIFNLLLLADKQGRYALRPRIRRGSILVGLMLTFSVTNLVLHFTTEFWADIGLIAGGLSLLHSIPVYAAFSVEPGWPTKVAAIASSILVGTFAIVFALCLYEVLMGAVPAGAEGVFWPLFYISLYGGIAAMWGTNFLHQAEPRT